MKFAYSLKATLQNGASAQVLMLQEIPYVNLSYKISTKVHFLP